MTDTYALAALWLGLALVATLVSIWLRVATALSEIVVGTLAQLIIGDYRSVAVFGAGRGRHRERGRPDAERECLVSAAASSRRVVTMYRKILLGYDGSEAPKKAFETACDLATMHGAELTPLAVVRPPEVGDDVETQAAIESARRHHGRMLAELKPALAAKKIKAHLEVGIGHRGRTRFAQLLLGSVAKHVTEHADRPVLVVH